MTPQEFRTIPLTQKGPSEGENFEYHWIGEFVEAHLLSDVGKKRKRNEDSCIVCAPADPALAEARGLLFAVADGMGGASAGDFASHLALDVLVDEYYHGPSNNIPLRLRDALDAANQRVFIEAESNLERHGMGTTVSDRKSVV
jgi:protein phosphatase